ncbi:exodeoxyribonuclease VII large subunit [Weissella oryzae SG25]|uniref:Exodeoxyribonuclease 7 large subunit n=1 Tax=Weissella oryzae (strain DSM 25784 / JCM 18191 / LMG 30913 / SG25) TaxID=1329250 RepID=A0A069CVL0_WEIOS|nr:exodeoxyribonuclease VII large subunit [Weissella oryzae]GAK31422.1 exodeoxyribonuclease VII large subunit [Weissella oryzae SG25]
MAEYLTVSTLTKYLKRKFTADPYLKEVYLTGEVSNYRQRPGHQYFSLKDDGAVISATMFKGVFDKLPFKLEAGMKVNVVGYVDLYGPNGSYSIIINRLNVDGVGALYQALEQLKAKLAQQGTFKVLERPIERFPKKIAVITSPSGAVIRDIMTTVQRRYPIAEIILYPAVVQGNGAVPSLLKQLDLLAERTDIDTLIIGRGGGSIEDLWAFNDETLAQKLLTMPMPVISSVGHETDTTIADYIADKRAATPTAAAELATPIQLVDLWSGLQQLQGRLIQRIQLQIMQQRQRLNRVEQSYVLTQPARLYEGHMQRLDLVQQRLQRVMQAELQNYQHRFAMVVPRLNQLIERYLERANERFSQAAKGLNLVSPLAILGRGYSLVSNKAGLVRSIDDVALDESIEIRTNDGILEAKVTRKEESNGEK